MGFDSFTGLLGGLGLFLVGMWLMTDGLKVAAGPSLKQILERWTNTRAKGLAAGFSLTALVQSSSAVTVAAIGFVNAGVLTLGHAVWVIFGSAVGTTMTGWIVSAVGFNVDIKVLALPAIGVGMILRLTAPSGARGAIGEAIAGFGIFFLGVSVLKDSFEGVAGVLQLDTLSGGGFLHYVLFVFAGLLITAMAQSSSASIAIALSAVSGGLIDLPTGAAMVIGANIGTTVTGILAVLDATSNAKRVAAAHFIFNLSSAAIACVLLPVFFWGISWLGGRGWGLPEPAMILAIFHTSFNLLGLLSVWFWADRMVEWLKTRFVSQEESEARPQHLDKTLQDMPSLAAASLLLELRRFGGIASGMVAEYLKAPLLKAAQVKRRVLPLAHLSEAIGDYAAAMSGARLPDRLPEALAHALRALQHYNGIVHELEELMDHAAEIHQLPHDLAAELRAYRNSLAELLDTQTLTGGDALSARGQAFEAEYQRIKDEVLKAASRGGFTRLHLLDGAVREADLIRRIAHHAVRAAMRIEAAEAIVAPAKPDAAKPSIAEAVARNE